MCRIVGRASKYNDSVAFEKDLRLMLASLAHGGPDDEGLYFDRQVAIGHRRLSIIDLSKAGHQPMQDEFDNLAISFNGEIYNYLELKKDLELKGFVFRTKTDTEVIMNAYRYWGVDSFDKLEGIFAFVLYDKEEQSLLLVRDHLGVKPLYYSLNDHELLFASEVRAFKSIRNDWEENKDWNILFLAFGSIPHPFTTLAGVMQIEPGSYLTINLEDFTSKKAYYYKPNGHNYNINTNQEVLNQMQLAIQKSVRKNLIADAPLGIFLSGGIDSSLLTLLADRCLDSVRTLSINFDDSHYDEHHYQQLVLEKTENVKHTSHRVSEHMFWEYLDDVWKAMDQPSIDAVNAYFVTRFAKEEGIKTVLSGLGADEFFGGYSSFKRIKWMRFARFLPKKRMIGQVVSKLKKSWGRLVYLELPGPIGDYLFLRGIHTPTEIALLLNVSEDSVWKALMRVPFEVPAKMNDMEYVSFLEARIYMSNQLLKDTDYMGMWHGVEVRVPFLDIELLKKIRTIPPTIRYNSDWPKYLLTAPYRNILPRKIIFRKKRGFTFPFQVWMSRSSKRYKALMPNTEQADYLYNQFSNGHCHWSKCWSLAVLQQYK